LIDKVIGAEDWLTKEPATRIFAVKKSNQAEAHSLSDLDLPGACASSGSDLFAVV
jgi:hypothetical protein